MRTDPTSVIPDGLKGRAGTQERPHSLNPWVPALRFAAAVMTGIFLATGAIAQPAPPLIHEPAVVAPGFEATMLIVNLPPAGDGPLTTKGQAGHRHPASTYAYVSKGAVINRLGDQQALEARPRPGLETPNPAALYRQREPHRGRPAGVVVQVVGPPGRPRLHDQAFASEGFGRQVKDLSCS